jgi:DegV family protein with EDD domain
MAQVRIVTDSAAELPQDLIDALGITVVPWRVQLGPEALIDGPGLRTVDFYSDMVKRRRTPVALAPTAQQFSEAYSRLARETDEVVSIHGPAELGKALQAARQGRLGLLGRCEVTVLDAQFTSRALGLLVVEGAKAAQAGLRGSDVTRIVYGAIPRTYFTFYVESIDHLVRQGLLREAREQMGIIAGYKPLLLLEEGRIVSLQRSRRRGHPTERLLEFISEFRGIQELYLLHTGLAPSVQDLRMLMAESLPQLAYSEHIYGPVLAALIGPAAMGFAAIEGAF